MGQGMKDKSFLLRTSPFLFYCNVLAFSKASSIAPTM